ncbi:MAG: hypothetical protein RR871_10495, partial [Carnobacterium sp.]
LKLSSKLNRNLIVKAYNSKREKNGGFNFKNKGIEKLVLRGDKNRHIKFPYFSARANRLNKLFI